MKAGRRRQDGGAGGGWVFYDSGCGLCVRLARRVERVLQHHGMDLAPLQSSAADRLGLAGPDRLREMRLLTAGGQLLGGADAVVGIARRIPWAWPLVWAARIPGAMPLLRWGYRQVADNRSCASEICSLPPEAGGQPTTSPGIGSFSFRRSFPWAGSTVLVLVIIALWISAASWPRWVFMWLVAALLFAVCKWLTLVRGVHDGDSFRRAGRLGYLFGWVGMDPAPFSNARFLSSRGAAVVPWGAGLRALLAGAGLLWVGVRNLEPWSPLAAGWAGMIGIVFMLHFGVFKMLACLWQSAGVPVTPLMREPWRAASVADFWGRRWNTGFHVLCRRFLFDPLLARPRRGGGSKVSGATTIVPTLIVFLASGLVHELVITIPARGGYGLPTAYFLIQGAGLICERAPLGRRWIADSLLRKRLFTMLVVIGPVSWLFPPVFVRNVILPMLHAIGAT